MKSTKVLPVIHEKMSWEITARAESRTIYGKDGRPLLFVMGTVPAVADSKLATIQIFPIIHNEGNTYIAPEPICSRMVTLENEGDLEKMMDYILSIRCSMMNNNGYLLNHLDLGLMIRMKYGIDTLTVASDPIFGIGADGVVCHKYIMVNGLLEVRESLTAGDWSTMYMIDPSSLHVTIDEKASAFLVKETNL